MKSDALTIDVGEPSFHVDAFRVLWRIAVCRYNMNELRRDRVLLGHFTEWRPFEGKYF